MKPSYYVHNKCNHHTCYYETKDHYEKALSDGGTAFVRMAETVYDHSTHEFLKYRYGDVELLNLMLEIQRAREKGLITHEMEKLVNEHA
jgi:hypothetical protein